MKRVSAEVFWQTTFAYTFLVNLIILIWSILRWIELKVILWRSVWIIPLVLYLAALAGCVSLFMWIRKGNASQMLNLLENPRMGKKPFPVNTLVRIIAGVVFVGILALIPYLKFSFHVGEVVKKSTQDPVLTTIVFYWVVWWLVLVASGALKLALKTNWAAGFAGALVLLGIAYEIFVRIQLVTPYPLSMGWSESSRYYYGSLFFSQSIYGMQLPLSTLHPSRYLLQALPFLFPGLSLEASRFWQFFLWVSLSGVSAASLSWRALSYGAVIKPVSFWIKTLFAGWIFLFLMRVGVYYHLEVMVFVPLLFVSAKHPWRSSAAILLASIWAGISRVNWFPVPAIIGIALYLLEEPVSDYKNIWTYLAKPGIWGVLGLASALVSQAVYISLSGNSTNAQAFASSFTSAKLWYRLWPNDSYPLGIILATVIVCGPLMITFSLGFLKNYKSLHCIRWAGLWFSLMTLLAGGLVVSVKIGGGGDLHNMDAFAVLLAVITAHFIAEKARPESRPQNGAIPVAGGGLPVLLWPVAATALLIPLLFLIPLLSPFQKFNQKGNQQAFEKVKELSEEAAQKGPVLFINERHLITFHNVKVPLVPDYEAVTLMEMAMSNNQVYLQQFYNDLKNHRFAAIVAGKQNIGIKEEGAFAEENNIWNSRVSPYILCYYEPMVVANIPEPVTAIEGDESRIEFYLPRSTPGVCP